MIKVINMDRAAKTVRTGVLVLFALALPCLAACNSGNPNQPGVFDEKLSPCPSSPNCVSSHADNAEQLIKPLAFDGPPEQAWALLIDQVSRLPRVTIIKQDDRYLHAECRSKIFGFVDDLEFLLRPERQAIDVRSASRTGYYDFGVNRNRIEQLRTSLPGRDMGQ